MMGEYITQSASSASSAATSFVAMTPIGPIPHSSPTSLPAFAALCTQQPTSSSSGCERMPSIAARPTPPVAHWIDAILHGRPPRARGPPPYQPRDRRVKIAAGVDDPSGAVPIQCCDEQRSGQQAPNAGSGRHSE